MIDLTTVLGLAKYEGKLLRRTWKFWILAVLGFLYLVIINLYYSGLYNFASGYSGTVSVLSAGLVVQIVFSQFVTLFSVLVIWFAYDFMSKDRRHLVDGVIHSRPLTTFGLVWGKFLGILVPTFVVALLLTVISVGLRFIPFFRLPFRVLPYVQQIFVLALPSLAFVIALVFFVTAVTKSRVAAIIIAHAYVIIDMVMLVSLGRWLRLEYVPMVDYSGYALTNFHSDLIGFTDFGLLLLQRVYIIAITLLLLALTAVFYPRLKQEGKNSRPVLATIAICALIGVGYVGYRFVDGHRDVVIRDQAKTEQKELFGCPLTTVSHYDIDINLTRNQKLSATAAMTLLNTGEQPQQVFTFVLNSGLEVESVTGAGGQPLEFERGSTTLTINTPTVPAGGETTVSVAYSGGLDLTSLFLGSEAEIFELKGQKRNNVTLLGYQPFWISPGCTYLVPEVRWYPTPNLDYGYEFPDKRPVNYATAAVRVTVPEGIQALSQGRFVERTTSPEGDTVIHYLCDQPVPGLSVNSGDYNVLKTEVGGLEVAFYYIEKHKKNVEFFSDAGDEIRTYLEEKLERVEEATGLDYPYPSLALVEVPSTMRSYSEGWDSPNPMIQPGVVMLKESGFFNANFKRAFDGMVERRERNNEEVDPGKVKVDMLGLFFDLDLVSGSLLENVMPNFWSFRLDAAGPMYPLAGRCMDNYVSELVTGYRPFRSIYAMMNLNQLLQNGLQSRFGSGGEVAWQDAFYLASSDLDRVHETLDEKPLEALVPDEDPELYFNVMNYKGRGFVMTLKEVLGEEAFRNVLAALIEQYEYRPFSVDDLARVAGEVSGQEVGWIFDQWLYETEIPGYRLSSVDAHRIDMEGEAPLYQIKVQVSNEEPARGFTVLTFETKGDEVERRIMVGGNETVEVALVVPDEPERVVLNPIVARNKEYLRESFRIPEEPVKAEPLEHIQVVEAAALPEEEAGTVVTVDDVDDGFTLVSPEGSGLLRWRAKREDEEKGERLAEYGRGRPDQWENWTHSDDDAYGLYNRTLKIKKGGEGHYSAIWTAEMPKRGRYEVMVYIGVAGDDIRTRREENQKLGTDYVYAIEHEDGSEEVPFNANNAEKGWNSLGVFFFTPDNEARITLTDKTDGVVIVDAVKFVLKEDTTTP